MNSSRATHYAVWLTPIALAGIGFAFYSATDVPWQPPSLRNPLGTDEFGRDILGETAFSIINSLAVGALLALVATTVGLAVAYFAVLWESWFLARGIVILGQAVESIPVIFWLLAALAAVPYSPQPIKFAIFTLATLPMTSRILIGEFERLVREPFVEAIKLLGSSGWRLTVRHLIPNATPVLIPLIVQLAGFAVAIDGALGLVGLGNRSALDLGILILRGKEFATVRPQLLLVGVGALLLTYAYLWLIVNIWRVRRHDALQGFV